MKFFIFIYLTDSIDHSISMNIFIFVYEKGMASETHTYTKFITIARISQSWYFGYDIVWSVFI